MTAQRVRNRREIIGVVVSSAMDKTVIVEVMQRVRHALYEKYHQRRRRYFAHDPKNSSKKGDRVRIVKGRRLSLKKNWILGEILESPTLVE